MAIAFCGIIALVIVWLYPNSPQKTVAADASPCLPVRRQRHLHRQRLQDAPGPARRHHRMAECRQPDQLRKNFGTNLREVTLTEKLFLT